MGCQGLTKNHPVFITGKTLSEELKMGLSLWRQNVEPLQLGVTDTNHDGCDGHDYGYKNAWNNTFARNNLSYIIYWKDTNIQGVSELVDAAQAL